MLVGRAVAELFSARSGAVIRFEHDGAVMVAAYSSALRPGHRAWHPGLDRRHGQRFVRRGGRPAAPPLRGARRAAGRHDDRHRRPRVRLETPIVVSGELWGTVAVTFDHDDELPDALEHRAPRASPSSSPWRSPTPTPATARRPGGDRPADVAVNHRAFHERLEARRSGAAPRARPLGGDLRPRRLQAGQRHLRPPRRRRGAGRWRAACTPSYAAASCWPGSAATSSRCSCRGRDRRRARRRPPARWPSSRHRSRTSSRSRPACAT